MVKPCSITDPTSTVITSDSTEHNPCLNEPCTNKGPNPTSKMYKGVRKRKWGKWVSEIRLPNSRERIWLGSYDTQEKAARAFDAALYCLRGTHANFNFPDTPLNFDNIIHNVLPHLSTNNSLSHQEIQEAAAKFANDVIPEGENNNSNNNSNSRAQEEEEPLSSGSRNVCANSTNSVLSPVHDYGGAGQVDHGDTRAMDWTFLNVLDHDTNYNNNVGVAGYDYFGVYSGLDKMHYSGEFLYNSTTPPTFFAEDGNGEEIEGGDAFSHHSFLWSWNF